MGTLIRPVGRLEQLSYYPQLCARVRALIAAGHSAAAVAAQLHAEAIARPNSPCASIGRRCRT